MANINTNGLAMEMSEEAVKAYEAIAEKLPNIRDFDRTPERLLNLQGENADIIGALFKNSLGEAEYVCRNGRAIVQCAEEISRIDRRVGLAMLAGGVAIGLGCYVLYKLNEQQRQIDALAEAGKSTAVGLVAAGKGMKIMNEQIDELTNQR